MPVMAFDAQDVPPAAAPRPAQLLGLQHPQLLEPHPRYCRDPARAAHEFRALTDALHAPASASCSTSSSTTAEAGASGPVINFKGLANDVFYTLDPADRRRYRDFTGCGNTVSCNHPLVTPSSSTASSTGSSTSGRRLPLRPRQRLRPRRTGTLPPIRRCPGRSSRRRSWPGADDRRGLGRRWPLPGRRFPGWPGPNGTAATATRSAASSAAIHGPPARSPPHRRQRRSLRHSRLPGSINYVTCHDGFTLHDLVSYNRKHNEANGEDNRDGSDDNLSWNCGAEGETADPSVLALRQWQAATTSRS